MIGSLVLVSGAVVALAPTDLLALRTARTGAALPASWVVRPVRGQRAPMSLIMDSAGEGFVRLSGTGTAGWFVHRPRDTACRVRHDCGSAAGVLMAREDRTSRRRLAISQNG